RRIECCLLGCSLAAATAGIAALAPCLFLLGRGFGAACRFATAVGAAGALPFIGSTALASIARTRVLAAAGLSGFFGSLGLGFGLGLFRGGRAGQPCDEPREEARTRGRCRRRRGYGSRGARSRLGGRDALDQRFGARLGVFAFLGGPGQRFFGRALHQIEAGFAGFEAG